MGEPSAAPQRWRPKACCQCTEICELEASQHVVARELLLGSLDAKPRLHAIHDEMGAFKVDHLHRSGGLAAGLLEGGPSL